MLRASGKRISCIATSMGDVDLFDDSPGNAHAMLDRLRPSIDAAASMHAPLVYFTSGKTPCGSSTDAAAAAFTRMIPPAIDYAASRHVLLAAENNSVSTRNHGFAHSLTDTFQLAREAKIAVCVELQNSWYERNFASLVRDNVDLIGLVQVSDFRTGEDLRMNRMVPGDGSMPIAWMMEKLLGAGYQGAFDLEILGPHIEKEGYASAIGRGVEWMDTLLVRLGAGRSLLPRRMPAACPSPRLMR
jgi:sugar phosphate isomerase/epimerase